LELEVLLHHSLIDQVPVYDHKMLWRANLYIDEGGEDWNVSHPWNDNLPGVDENHLTRILNEQLISGSLNDDIDWEALTERTGDGGQTIYIPPYTSYNDHTITGAVSYDYPQKNIPGFNTFHGYDSPFWFVA
jgi:hypothetical protein